tara:strand:+ start:607 stop:1026 length:420 start_codon:yes stop_codon:yes gene_type:complete
LIKKISPKDKRDWENFINSKDKLENKDFNFSQNTKNIIEKTIDLHGYSLNEASIKIIDFIEKSYAGNVNKINIITGKGNRSKNKEDPYQSNNLSILKYYVPEFIKNHDELMKKIKNIDFKSVNDENLGSFSVILKRKKL